MKFPIGTQSFHKVRKSGAYYVDKTALLERLVNEGRYYFLSRPRRFGKSLLVDTLRELFEGQEELFRGLSIHSHWDWSVKHPVIRISFDGKYNRSGDLERSILHQLEIIERNAGIEISRPSATGPERLLDLLDLLHRTYGKKVVVLVDEYDKPILDVLDDPELANENRDYLRGFYGIIKGSEEHVRFVFVTGITMFSKVSLFSGLNILEDISLDPQSASICGFTDEEIDTVFAAELEGLDRQEIRRWYNGYHWRGEHKLYNPWDILLLLKSQEFVPYWFETGAPRYLYELLEAKDYPVMKLDGEQIEQSQLTQFDVQDIELRALMFQSGYLTIAEEFRGDEGIEFTLKYPNLVVRTNFAKGLLYYLGLNGVAARKDGRALMDLLLANDFDQFAVRVNVVYAAMPHQWYRKNAKERNEGHYLSLLYVHFNAVGADVRAEESSSHGQSDLVLTHAGQVFVMEAKVIDSDSEAQIEATLSKAMEQMRKRGYATKYEGGAEPVHLLTLVFGSEVRNLLAFRAEVA